ncbi:uncharacterized protein BKA78DRAFT_192288 [Phyllosticta capitalensis]|uniref:uncharacterized protein n=1 Tax=Phyllosticta capitalensis TaxID=121624 RepID=UPI00312FCB1F
MLAWTKAAKCCRIIWVDPLSLFLFLQFPPIHPLAVVVCGTRLPVLGWGFFLHARPQRENLDGARASIDELERGGRRVGTCPVGEVGGQSSWCHQRCLFPEMRRRLSTTGRYMSLCSSCCQTCKEGATADMKGGETDVCEQATPKNLRFIIVRQPASQPASQLARRSSRRAPPSPFQRWICTACPNHPGWPWLCPSGLADKGRGVGLLCSLLAQPHQSSW